MDEGEQKERKSGQDLGVIQVDTSHGKKHRAGPWDHRGEWKTVRFWAASKGMQCVLADAHTGFLSEGGMARVH